MNNIKNNMKNGSTAGLSTFRSRVNEWVRKAFSVCQKESTHYLGNKEGHCSRWLRFEACFSYTRKNYESLKTGLNNVVLPILLIVVNDIEQVVEPESSPQSGVTMLNNIVDIIEQCGQHNIVQSCFQQPVGCVSEFTVPRLSAFIIRKRETLGI